MVGDEATGNWRFIIFLSCLALIMIASSHSADRKVHEIAALNNRVKELKSEYLDVRKQVTQTKMESKITRAMKKRGLAPSENPPQIIKITTQN